MNWIAHYFDRRLNRDSISRAFASKEDALREACDLTRGAAWCISSKARTTKKSTLSRSPHGASITHGAETRPSLQGDPTFA